VTSPGWAGLKEHLGIDASTVGDLEPAANRPYP